MTLGEREIWWWNVYKHSIHWFGCLINFHIVYRIWWVFVSSSSSSSHQIKQRHKNSNIFILNFVFYRVWDRHAELRARKKKCEWFRNRPRNSLFLAATSCLWLTIIWRPWKLWNVSRLSRTQMCFMFIPVFVPNWIKPFLHVFSPPWSTPLCSTWYDLRAKKDTGIKFEVEMKWNIFS